MLVCVQHGFSTDGLPRVIQGIVMGIGFVGAGSIIKLNDELDVRGLTTAVGIWIAASIGVAVGLGAVGLAAIGTVFALLILSLTKSIDDLIDKRRNAQHK